MVFEVFRSLNSKADHLVNWDLVSLIHGGMDANQVLFLNHLVSDLGITDRGNQWGLKTKEYTISDTPNFADLNRRGAIGSNGSLVSTYARLLIRKL